MERNYIRCFDCEKRIEIGDRYFVEECGDGIRVPYCTDCYGRTLEKDDDMISEFWEYQANWASDYERED